MAAMLSRTLRLSAIASRRAARPSAALLRTRLCSTSSVPSPAQPTPTITIEEAPAADAEEDDADAQLERAMRPKEIVEQLDRYIVGQPDAKRAVAVAMRNRWRRQRVSSPLREEISPKNILMIGPTGVGKTEVARRLAKLARAPFIKVEATKFTEVGFVGKDVDQIIRDLVDVALALEKTKASPNPNPDPNSNPPSLALEKTKARAALPRTLTLTLT